MEELAANRGVGARVLHHRSDLAALAVVVAVAVSRSALVVFDREVSAVLVGVSVAVMPVVWAIKHNAIHGPVFTSRRLDHCYHGLLTVLTGTSSANTAVVHNAIHHRHNNSASDWTSVDLAYRFRWPLLRLVTYPVPVIRALAANKKRYLATRPALRRRIAGETVLALLAVGVTVAVSPWRSLCYVVVPIVFGQWFLIAMNYLQHAGCHHGSPLGHAVNHTGRVFNRVLFNLGYHTAHHLAPEAHWSELPGIHRRRVAADIDPRLLEPSFLRHVVDDYVLRFDRR